MRMEIHCAVQRTCSFSRLHFSSLSRSLALFPWISSIFFVAAKQPSHNASTSNITQCLWGTWISHGVIFVPSLAVAVAFMSVVIVVGNGGGGGGHVATARKPSLYGWNGARASISHRWKIIALVALCNYMNFFQFRSQPFLIRFPEAVVFVFSSAPVARVGCKRLYGFRNLRCDILSIRVRVITNDMYFVRVTFITAWVHETRERTHSNDTDIMTTIKAIWSIVTHQMHVTNDSTNRRGIHSCITRQSHGKTLTTNATRNQPTFGVSRRLLNVVCSIEQFAANTLNAHEHAPNTTIRWQI